MIPAWLLVPGPVLADNCSSLSDCFGTSRAAVASLAALLVITSLVLQITPGSGPMRSVYDDWIRRHATSDASREELEDWEFVLGIAPFAAGTTESPSGAAGTETGVWNTGSGWEDRPAQEQQRETDDSRGDWTDFQTEQDENRQGTGWRAVSLHELSPQEAELLESVRNASFVLIGTGRLSEGRGMFTLQAWLDAQGLASTQRWLDVYHRAIYERTASGAPVHVYGQLDWSLGESSAAEAGAKRSGIRNLPYWPGQRRGEE